VTIRHHNRFCSLTAVTQYLTEVGEWGVVSGELRVGEEVKALTVNGFKPLRGFTFCNFLISKAYLFERRKRFPFLSQFSFLMLLYR